MAKGDAERAQTKIDEQGGLAQNHLNNMRDQMIVPQAQTAQNNASLANDQAFQDYGRIMGGYQDFAKTGGFNPSDLGAIRSRSLAPLRGMYADANRDVDRKVALQGGYSPGYGTLKSRLARDMSSGMSDAALNTEGAIAQMVNQGKQFGMAGQSNMYSATPGMANMFNNQQNQTMNNWLQTQGLQNQLGLGLIGAQIQKGQLQGKNSQAFDNVKKGVQFGSDIIGSF